MAVVGTNSCRRDGLVYARRRAAMPRYRMTAPRVQELVMEDARLWTAESGAEVSPQGVISTLVPGTFKDAGIELGCDSFVSGNPVYATLSGDAVYVTLGDPRFGPGGLAELDTYGRQHRGKVLSRTETLERIFRRVVRELYWQSLGYSDHDRPFPVAPIEADVHAEEGEDASS
jgi:hypothetical protein